MLRQLIIAAALALPVSAAAQDTAPAPAPSKKTDYVRTVAPFDHVEGSADAPHTMIVYASNMCPHCREWFNDEWPTVKETLVETGQLRLVFRPLPTEPAQLSMIGFLLAECDGDNYFARMENQFQRQPEILKLSKTGGLREYYPEMAKDYGLDDVDAMNVCLSNRENLSRIMDHGDRYEALGIRGVPAFVLNGKAYKGPHKAKDFVAMLAE